MDLHACIMLCNEEYWIYYVLRDLTLFFPVMVYDTGSEDATCDIIRDRFPEVELAQVGKKSPEELGVLRQEMFGKARYSILKVDGDEWYSSRVLKLLKKATMPQGKSLGWVTRQVVGLRPNGRFFDAGGSPNDCIFTEPCEWERDYPFELHSLRGVKGTPEAARHYYFREEYRCWHFRFLRRSSMDSFTYFRGKKQHWFEKDFADRGDIALQEMLGETPIFNPYFSEVP